MFWIFLQTPSISLQEQISLGMGAVLWLRVPILYKENNESVPETLLIVPETCNMFYSNRCFGEVAVTLWINLVLSSGSV